MRTDSVRPHSTGFRALILAVLFGMFLALAGAVAFGPSASAANGPAGVYAASATPEPTPDETTEEAPAEETPIEDGNVDDPTISENNDPDVTITNNDGFPMWATVLLLVLGIALIAAIAYAATRNRDTRDRI
jgi:hypothetical protein